MIFIFIGLLLALIWPDSAWAWGPSAHLSFSLEILDKLALLPHELQRLLGFYQPHFLYGSISADIIVGKKFIAYRHHCHNWAVGQALYQQAPNEATRAFMLGYLSHLAADTIAHNLYVPIKTVQAYPHPTMGHLYWELRYDQAVRTPQTDDMFYSLACNPFSDQDRFLQGSLKPTLFSFTTNKKIFNGLLILQRLKRWQDLMQRTASKATTELSPIEISRYRELSLNAILSFLIDQQQSTYLRLDPTGSQALHFAGQTAKNLRKKGNPALTSVEQACAQLHDAYQNHLTGVADVA